METTPSPAQARPLSAVVLGLLNIRSAALLSISTGWFVLFISRRVTSEWDPSTSNNEISSEMNVHLVLLAGAAIAFAYGLVAVVYRWRRMTSVLSTFFLTILLAPMVMLSFALAFGHALGSPLADMACVASGVFGLAVIAASWIATKRVGS